MSRKSMALIVSATLVLSSLSSSVSAQSVPAKPDQTTSATSNDAAKNASPLPAGGAAGIQQAQGLDSNDIILIAVGGALLIALLVWGLSNNDSSTSTAN